MHTMTLAWDHPPAGAISAQIFRVATWRIVAMRHSQQDILGKSYRRARRAETAEFGYLR
jgi:hypothetical protein